MACVYNHNMDSLITQFSSAATLWQGPELYVERPIDDPNVLCVWTRTYIPSGRTIGEVVGNPCYIWDITHTDYVIVGDDLVLDMSEVRAGSRSPLSFLRDDNSSPHPANCTISACVNEDTGLGRFFVISTRDVHPGEELVYTIGMCM